MDIRQYLGVLRRGVAFLVLGVLLGGAAGYAFSTMQHPVYSATSKNIVTSANATDLNTWVQANNFTNSRLSSYVLVATSGLVLQPVIDQLKLPTTVDALAGRITVTNPTQTMVVDITATATTAAEAQSIANAVATQFSTVVSTQLDTGAAAALAPVKVVTIEQAGLPGMPAGQNGILYALVGAVIGLALALVAASLREALDTRIRSARDLALVTGVPIVGQIPVARELRAGALVARNGSGTSIAESFRALRAHVDRLRLDAGERTFVVTAAVPGEGSTTIVANLAVALVSTGVSVVVVDADLRHGSLSAIFGAADAPGLAEVLARRATPKSVLRQSGPLVVLPAGARPVNPGELLATPTMRDLLAELDRRFEVVLIDAPSIAEVTDAAVLGAHAAPLLVVGSGIRGDALGSALDMLAAGGVEPIGIVLSRAARRSAAEVRAEARNERRAARDAEGWADVAPEARPYVAPMPVVVPAHRAEQMAITGPTPPVGDAAVAPDAPAAAPALVVAAPAAPVVQPAPVPVASAAVQVPAASTPAAPVPAAPQVRVPAVAPARVAPAAVVDPTPRTPVPSVPIAAPASGPVVLPVPQPTAAEQRAGAVPPASPTGPIPQVPAAQAPAVQAPAAVPTSVPASAAATAQPIPPASVLPALPSIEIPVRPEPKRTSRFAPDPAKFAPGLSAYLGAAPVPRTVVNTVSVGGPTSSAGRPVRPPIAHILPTPGPTDPTMRRGGTGAATAAPASIPSAPAVAAVAGPYPAPVPADLDEDTARDELPRVYAPRRAPITPVGPLRLVPPLVVDEDADDSTVVPVASSARLIDEIGGVRRVEVRSPRPSPHTGTLPERRAREAYELRARELERAAQERLLREQARVERDIRTELESGRRELESVLDNRLDDTVTHP